MPSPQALSESDRRIVAAWAADCAERVLPLFEAEVPDDDRARDAIARARGFARGELDAAGQIRRRFEAGRAAHAVTSPAAVAAARAAAQASGVAHMGAHALGAAAYAARAAGLAEPRLQADGDRSDDRSGDPPTDRELRWQLDHLTDPVRTALRRLPALGTDTSGPLGPGLLARGALGEHIRALQHAIGSATLSP
ncbi:putative immunity protein [Curtobacterium pusillum]|uniref:putative immunity protein n=1 Tax=Curtobacterium pusillum TaxID=69373 RepID=UPI0038148C58